MEDLSAYLDGENSMSCVFAGENRASMRQAAPYGFSLMELVVTVAIILIISGIAIPMIGSAMSGYQLKAATVSVTGAIQATRYRAISSGYEFRVVFSSANMTYQVQSDPNRTGTYGAVGSAVPITSSKVTLNADTTLQFRPSGAVSATTGAMTMVLALGTKNETITVLPYGNTTVTP
jgi:prepilin-type N-terminal cleavage/methylation domain-containing protein